MGLSAHQYVGKEDFLRALLAQHGAAPGHFPVHFYRVCISEWGVGSTGTVGGHGFEVRQV